MIAVAQRNHIVIAGVKAGHEEREVVGFGTGIDEITDGEIAGEFVGESLAIKTRLLGWRRWWWCGRGCLTARGRRREFRGESGRN